MAANTTVIRVGLTTTVLADRFRTRSAPRLPKEAQDAWWARTDYAWVCSHPACQDTAGVNYKTERGARKGADAHAKEHPGAHVETALNVSEQT